MGERTIRVEVVYAGIGQPTFHRVKLAADSTVIQAINASGIVAMLPGGVLDLTRLGIFSRHVSPQDVLREGDRIEIYRPLIRPPMEARRRRAHRLE